MNISAGFLFILFGVICFVLRAVGLGVAVDLWVLGWAFVVAGALLFGDRGIRS